MSSHALQWWDLGVCFLHWRINPSLQTCLFISSDAFVRVPDLSLNHTSPHECPGLSCTAPAGSALVQRLNQFILCAPDHLPKVMLSPQSQRPALDTTALTLKQWCWIWGVIFQLVALGCSSQCWS